MPLSLENIRKAKELGASDDQILSSIEQNEPEFGNKIRRARDLGATDEQMIQSIESHLEQQNVKPLNIDKSNIEPSTKQDVSKANDNKSYVDLIRPPEYTREQLKKMSFAEKREYIEDLNRYREYMTSVSNIKSFADTATFGLAPKYIKDLRKTEEEAEFSGLVGDLIGLTGPGAVLYKVVGKPVVNLIQKAPKYIPGLNAIAHMTGSGAVGATYGGIHDTVVNEELPSAKQLATHFAEWATFDGILRGIVNGALYLKTLQRTRSAKKVTEVMKRVNLEETNPEVLSKQVEKALHEVIPEELIAAKKQELTENRSSKVNEAVEQRKPQDQRQAVQEDIQNIKGNNKKKLAQEAFDNGDIKSQEDLNMFLDRYESAYPSIIGKTTADKNRKFMTRYAKSTVAERGVEVKQGEAPVEIPIEARLIDAVRRLIEAKLSGDTAKIKEAQKRLDLLKRKIQNAEKTPDSTQERASVESPREKLGVSNLESKAAKGDGEGNAETLKSSTLSLKPKPLAVQIKTQNPPVVESTGQGASHRLDNPKTLQEKVTSAVNTTVDAIKNPGKTVSAAGQAINEKVFNFLAPLERIETNIPRGEKPSEHIHAALDASATIESTIENGVYSNVDNVLQNEGLKDIYGDYTWKKKIGKGLPEDKLNINELNEYRTNKEALKRQQKGLKSGIDTEIAKKDVARLAKKYEPVAQRIRNYNRAVNSEYGKDLLGEEGVQRFNEGDHSSLYRALDTGGDALMPSGSLEPKKPWRRAKGGTQKIIPPTESDIFNTSMMIQNSKKNRAVLQLRESIEKGQIPGKVHQAKNNAVPDAVKAELESKGVNLENEGLVENVYNQTRKDAFTPSRTRLRGWKDGKPFELEVPEEIVQVYKGMTPPQLNPISRAFEFSKRAFSRGLTFDPRKYTSIFARDALSAMIYSKHRVTPIDIAKAIGDILGNKEIYKTYKNAGGNPYANRMARRLDRQKSINEFVTPGHEGPVVPLSNIYRYLKKNLKKFGNIDQAVGLAEYKKALAKYGDTPQGRLMALVDAKSVTYNPRMKGNFAVVRELSPYFNFFNVTLQDMAMVGKNLKRPEVWATGAMYVALPTMALKMWNDGNPKYDALTPIDKAAYWHLFFGDHHVRVPIPWLLGTTFKVIPETMYDVTKGDSKAHQGLLRNAVDQMGLTLNPIIQTSIEAMTGKSPSSLLGLITGQESKAGDVIPQRYKNLPKELQYTPTTSQLSRNLAPALGLSPIALDRFISNFGANIAKDILALTDELVYRTGFAEDKRPEQNLSNYLLLGNFVTEMPPNRTKYAERFYEYLDAYKTSKEAEKNGIQSPDFDKLSNAGLSKYNTSINKLFREYRNIQNESLDKGIKKQRLSKIQQEINDLYKQAVDAVERQ